MSLGLILVILLVIFLFGGFSGRFGGYGYGYGHGGVGIIGAQVAGARMHYGTDVTPLQLAEFVGLDAAPSRARAPIR